MAAGKDGGDVLEAEAEVVEGGGIDFDAHGGRSAAADEDLPDAGDLRKLLREDGIGDVVHLALGVDVGGASR